MTSTDFDSISAAKRLRDAGFNADHADLATKADVAALRTEMKAELGTIRWAVGSMAAFTFAVGLRVFGLI